MQKDLDSPNLSTVEKASFLEGLQLHGGECLLILVLFMISMELLETEINTLKQIVYLIE